MTTIIAKHGKTYTLADGDQITFGGLLKSTEGDSKSKPGRFAYRWGKAAVCYLYVPRLELVEGSTYRTAAAVETPAPTPAPPPPPPAPEPTTPPALGLKSVIASGEVFLETDDITLGFSAWGGLGTIKNASAGFRTDAAHGFLRVGMVVPGLTDITLPGRSIEGSGWVINGVRYANMELAGWKGIPGSWTDPQTWVGSGAGIKTEQRVTITGKTVRIEITDTNTTDKPITVRPFRSIDPDQSEKYVTTNKVSAAGVMECTLADNSGKLTIRAPGAAFHYGEYNECQNIGTLQAVGVTRVKDEVVQAVWPAYTLNPGASQVRVLEYEVVTE